MYDNLGVATGITDGVGSADSKVDAVGLFGAVVVATRGGVCGGMLVIIVHTMSATKLISMNIILTIMRPE
jgi:hypothetical protein